MALRGNQCDTCGSRVLVDGGVHVCGTCATNWNDPDREAGLRRINARRRVNGLPALELRGGNVHVACPRERSR